jgi:hypothetical protein
MEICNLLIISLLFCSISVNAQNKKSNNKSNNTITTGYGYAGCYGSMDTSRILRINSSMQRRVISRPPKLVEKSEFVGKVVF